MEDIREINSFTRNCYNTIADKYHELFKNEVFEKEFDRKLLDDFALSFNSDSLICDAGCGPSAHIGRYLYDKGIKVIGTDISDRCIDIARSFNPGMEFYRVDFWDWNFPEAYFDGIISFYSIVYTPRIYIDQLLQKFVTSLKPKGKLLLVVKEGDTEGYIDEVLGIKTNAYFTYFKEIEIKDYLTDNGFDVKYLFTREPMDFEIAVKRIYAIGEKIE